MKKILVFIFGMMVSTPLFAAVAPDIRISDRHGHVVDITAAGNLQISGATDSGTVMPSAAPDIRISDNSGRVLDVQSNGKLTIKLD